MTLIHVNETLVNLCNLRQAEMKFDRNQLAYADGAMVALPLFEKAVAYGHHPRHAIGVTQNWLAEPTNMRCWTARAAARAADTAINTAVEAAFDNDQDDDQADTGHATKQAAKAIVWAAGHAASCAAHAAASNGTPHSVRQSGRANEAALGAASNGRWAAIGTGNTKSELHWQATFGCKLLAK